MDYDPIDDITGDPIENPLANQNLSNLPTNLSKQEQFGSLLVGELPRCPECSKLLNKRNLNLCNYCGFSYSYLEKLLPADQLPSLETLLDYSNRLDVSEKKCILKAIDYIQKRYPQFIPKVCLLPLQPDIEVHQMALWMVNQCPVLEGEIEQDKEWYILLLIDTSISRCALAYGYQAEIFIPDESAWKLVSSLNRDLKNDHIGDHIVGLLNKIVPLLDGTKKMLQDKYKHFKRES